LIKRPSAALVVWAELGDGGDMVAEREKWLGRQPNAGEGHLPIGRYLGGPGGRQRLVRVFCEILIVHAIGRDLNVAI
jgi:hypothetical protein